MTDWVSGALDDLCEVEYGTRVTRKRDGGTKYPVYGGGGATFNLDDFNRQDQMIVSRFAMSEECVRFVSGKFFLNDSGLTVRTRDESKMSQEFLDQQLLTRSNEIYATARGTAQKNMDMTMFRAMELSYPDSLREQKRIVAMLDAATARVTELTACYEQARTHANNLFTSALRNALESDPDWPIKTLGDLLEVSIGGIWGSEAGEDEVDVFVYRSTELIKDGQLKEELTVRRSITARQLDSRKLEEGDLLLEKSGGGPKTPVGRVGLVKILPGLSVCSNFMQLMRPRKKDVLPVYLHYFLNHFHVAGHTEDLQNNSTNIRNLKTTEYMDVEIPLPPLVEQKNIVSRMDSMRAKTSEMVAAYDAKLTAAKNLRQSILEAAFAGEL
jgi:type I restriction enzyme S subunit